MWRSDIKVASFEVIRGELSGYVENWIYVDMTGSYSCVFSCVLIV